MGNFLPLASSLSLVKLSSCQNESHPFYYQVTGQMFIYFIIICNKSEVVQTGTLSGVDTVQCISEASPCCSHVSNCRTRNIQAVILSHLVPVKVMLLYKGSNPSAHVHNRSLVPLTVVT